MKISRDWATPLTIGAFVLMSVTGILMFFHMDTGLNKLAHEWLGWVMVVGVVAHAAANWLGFKRYFTSSTAGRAIIALSVLVLAGSFASLPGKPGGQPPHVMALRAVTSAPIGNVAALTGKPVAQLIDELGKAGIVVPGADATLDSVLKGNRELQAKAMRVLFRKG